MGAFDLAITFGDSCLGDFGFFDLFERPISKGVRIQCILAFFLYAIGFVLYCIICLLAAVTQKSAVISSAFTSQGLRKKQIAGVFLVFFSVFLVIFSREEGYLLLHFVFS